MIEKKATLREYTEQAPVLPHEQQAEYAIVSCYFPPKKIPTVDSAMYQLSLLSVLQPCVGSDAVICQDALDFADGGRDEGGDRV